MTKFIGFLVCGLLCALPAACAPNTIVQGQSVGHVHLGQNLSVVKHIIGLAPDNGDATSGRQINTWIANGKKGSRLEVITSYYVNYPDGRSNSRNLPLVEQIRITSTWFRTHRNLGVGSTWVKLRREFPQAAQVLYYFNMANQRVIIYDDKISGIAFEVACQNKLPTAETCTAIVVHPKNKNVLHEYMTFYPYESGQHLFHNGLKSMTHHSVL